MCDDQKMLGRVWEVFDLGGLFWICFGCKSVGLLDSLVRVFEDWMAIIMECFLKE
jgi:hypothetical protein